MGKSENLYACSFLFKIFSQFPRGFSTWESVHLCGSCIDWLCHVDNLCLRELVDAGEHNSSQSQAHLASAFRDVS